MLKKMPTLKGTFSGILLLVALVPSLLIASYLLERFRVVSEQVAVDRLEQIAQLITHDASRDFQLMFASIEQLSRDPDIVYASYNGAFGAKAALKLEKLDELHGSVYASMIVDTLSWPVEVSPTSLELLDHKLLSPSFNRFFAAPDEASIQMISLHHPELLQDIYRLQGDQQSQLRSEHLLMILSPLWLSAVDKSEMHELVGAMAVMLPVHNLFDELQLKLGGAKEQEITILNIEIAGKSLLSPEFIHPNLDDFIVIKLPLSIPNSPQNIELSLGVNRTATIQPIDALQLELWAIVVGLVILLGLAAFIGSRYLMQPVMVLSQLVKGYATSDYSQKRLRLRFRELQQIVDVLQQMAQRIVDEQHKLERRVEDRTRELSDANDTLQNTMSKLQATQTQLIESEKMSHLGQLVSGVAHEINTPVGVAVTASTMLQQQVDVLGNKVHQAVLTRNDLLKYIEDTQQTTGMINSNLQRAADLIRNFKEVAADQNSEQRRQFELYGYIRSILQSLEPEFKGYLLDVRVLGDSELMLSSYPGAYSQVLTNLIINSLRHGFTRNKAHQIQIQYEVHEQTLKLTYKDNGRGIDASTLPQIFNPFFTTQRTAGGTGLGLHIVYNVISQQLGGSIEAHSEVGTGVEFIIRVPLEPPLNTHLGSPT